MKSSQLPIPVNLLPKIAQEIIYELVSMAYNLDKIEKWEVASRRSGILRVWKSHKNYRPVSPFPYHQFRSSNIEQS